jgi:uroporphyrinogen decarboxylase
MRKPDFNNILKVLQRQAPDRPTLFEFFLNSPLYEHLCGEKTPTGERENIRFLTKAFAAAGYDYATVSGSSFNFPSGEKHKLKTISINENAVILDRKSFDAYDWPDPDIFDYSAVKDAELPEGLKLMVCGPCGVLENVMILMGYDNLAITLYDDPQLVFDVFEQVGTRLLRYYELSIKHKSVGILMSNDDWGFNTQTMLSPDDMKKYVFPWHKKIVELAHSAGIPAVLHSCGNFNEIMDYTIDILQYDGKHSYEDNILCVEESYRKWGSRIAILGGIDINFVVSKTPKEITDRCSAMLDLGKTGYALGTGNSVPEYVPWENYFAMTNAALDRS